MNRRRAGVVFFGRFWQGTTVTAAAKAAADAAALAAAEPGGAGVAAAATSAGDGETSMKAFELFKLSHNIKKMLGEQMGGGLITSLDLFAVLCLLSNARGGLMVACLPSLPASQRYERRKFELEVSVTPDETRLQSCSEYNSRVPGTWPLFVKHWRAAHGKQTVARRGQPRAEQRFSPPRVAFLLLISKRLSFVRAGMLVRVFSYFCLVWCSSG